MIGSAISGLSLPRSRLAMAAATLTSPRARIKRAGNGWPGDREILHGALGLGAVVRLGGHLDVAHRIFLDAELAHRMSSRNCLE